MGNPLLCLLSTLFLAFGSAPGEDEPLEWYAWLDTDGGQLGFGIELEQDPTNGDWSAYLVNEPERIPIPDVTWNGKELALELEESGYAEV